MNRFNENLFCEFTPSELEESGQELSSTMLEYDAVEEKKKAISKEYTDALKGLRGRMRRLSKNIRAKGEHRSIECIVRFHVPQVGEKTTVRTDTGEVLRVESMSGEERQENLFRKEVDELEGLYGNGPLPDEKPPEQPEAGA